VEYLEAGLRAAGLRSKVISNNIANLNTPDFRRSEVRFEELLAKVMAGGREEDLEDIAPEIVQPNSTPLNDSGNDVSIDLEIGELIKNGAQSRVYLRTLAKLYSQMELAITERL
jgi:flagellar basal-body rod protein FlgB